MKRMLLITALAVSTFASAGWAQSAHDNSAQCGPGQNCVQQQNKTKNNSHDDKGASRHKSSEQTSNRHSANSEKPAEHTSSAKQSPRQTPSLRTTDHKTPTPQKAEQRHSAPGHALTQAQRKHLPALKSGREYRVVNDRVVVVDSASFVTVTALGLLSALINN
jgi:hypothetical protein